MFEQSRGGEEGRWKEGNMGGRRKRKAGRIREETGELIGDTRKENETCGSI